MTGNSIKWETNSQPYILMECTVTVPQGHYKGRYKSSYQYNGFLNILLGKILSKYAIIPTTLFSVSGAR